MRLRIAKPFNDPDYIFELKHDAFHALAYVEEGECRRISVLSLARNPIWQARDSILTTSHIPILFTVCNLLYSHQTKAGGYDI